MHLNVNRQVQLHNSYFSVEAREAQNLLLWKALTVLGIYLSLLLATWFVLFTSTKVWLCWRRRRNRLNRHEPTVTWRSAYPEELSTITRTVLNPQPPTDPRTNRGQTSRGAATFPKPAFDIEEELPSYHEVVTKWMKTNPV